MNKETKKTKEELTPQEKAFKKQRHKERAKKVLKVILYIILLWIVIGAIVRTVGFKSNMNKVKSYPSANIPKNVSFEHYGDKGSGTWNIHTDHGLKVMQITDVHIGGGYSSIRKDSMAINAVAAMITAEKPDFVIVTGDISYPVPVMAGTINNKAAPKLFAELMETLGVNWTLCYGNHDTEAYSLFNREQITELYASDKYPHCLMEAGPSEVDGFGNQVFNVMDENGVVSRSLIVLDSHSYTDGDVFGTQWKYDNIHDNQIEWYKNTILGLEDQNKKVISSLPAAKAAYYNNDKNFNPLRSSCFFHIAMQEYRDAWYEYVENDFHDTENVKYHHGTAGEKGNIVYCGVHEDQMFETMQALGSTDSVFVGHDHLNNFSLNYKGIDLNYGMSIDYLAYVTMGIHKLGTQRGCRILNISKDGTLETYNENYYQDKYQSFYEKEPVTMQKIERAPVPEGGATTGMSAP